MPPDPPEDPRFIDLRLYLLGRCDLHSMNPGKLAAQAAHAANQFVFELASPPTDWLMTESELELVRAQHKAWEGETGAGFGTTLCLAICGEEIAPLIGLAQRAGFAAGITHDPCYPLQDGDIIHGFPLDTGGYLFGPKAEIKPLVGHLDLYP